MIITCKDCGVENKEADQFCHSCGQPLRKTVFIFGPLKKGTKLDGRYEILETIKTGGMGCVYKALYIKLNKITAVKELIPPYGTPDEQEQATEWFKREAKILSQLDHPSLPGFIDCFVCEGRYYLVMNFIEGEDLETKMNNEGNPGLPEVSVIGWARQILEVLDYIHSQDPPVIYRDIKPSNIMISNEGQCYLIDFGIARVLTTYSESQKTAIGTSGYAPIEQCKGIPEPRSDLYALGATMHHLLTGVPPLPFRFTPVSQHVGGISPELESIIMTVLSELPEDRYSDAREMLEALPEEPVGPEYLKIFEFKANGAITTGCSHELNLIYFGSRDKKLYCLDAKSGVKKWDYKTEGCSYVSIPCVSRGLVYFASGKKLYCLNSMTGKLEWDFDTMLGIETNPTVSGGMVYFGANDNLLYCLDATTGEKSWEFKTGGPILSSPCVCEEFIYFGSDDYFLYCLDAKDGKKIWSFKTDGMIKSSPCIFDRQVYFGSFDGKMYCLDYKNGRRIWVFKTDLWIQSSPYVHDYMLYFGSFDKKFYCLDTVKFGKKVWEFKTPDVIKSSPSVGGGFVYFGCNNGNLYCLDAKKGIKSWSFETDGKLSASPCIIDGLLYFGSFDEKVYCVDTGTRGFTSGNSASGHFNKK